MGGKLLGIPVSQYPRSTGWNVHGARDLYAHGAMRAASAHRSVQARIARVALAILSASAGALGLAATYQIDDTGTASADPTVAMRWEELSPRRRTSQLLTGTTLVRVHLNLLPWVGRSAR